MYAFDEDAVLAVADLVERSGGRGVDVGYLHEGVPVEEAGWYAKATYKGVRLIEEDHRGPVEACEALARRILTGGQCTHCGGLVTLSDQGGMAYEKATLISGKTWTAEQAAAAGQCRWTRQGRRWTRGCESEAPSPRPANRRTRRKRGR